MKKILISLVASATIATISASADTAFFDKTQSIGVAMSSSTSVVGDKTSDAEYGVNINGTFLKKLKKKEGCFLSAGVVIDADINKPQDDINTIIDVLPTFSVAIPNTQINVRGMIGYSYGISGDVTSDGLIYGGALSYDITPKISVEAKYLMSNMTSHIDGMADYDYDYNRIIVGANYSF